MLWVTGQRLAGVDAEELRVEPSGIVEETAAVRAGGPCVLRVGTGESVEVPIAVAGEVGDCVDTVADDLPKILG